MAQAAEQRAFDIESVRALFKIKNKYNEVFEVELKCWCYGLTQLKSEMHPAIVHRVIKEFGSVWREAVQNYFVVDFRDAVGRLHEAARKVISEKEIAFSLLLQFPTPDELNEDQAFVLAQILDQAETAFPGAIKRFERRCRTKKALLPEEA